MGMDGVLILLVLNNLLIDWRPKIGWAISEKIAPSHHLRSTSYTSWSYIWLPSACVRLWPATIDNWQYCEQYYSVMMKMFVSKKMKIAVSKKMQISVTKKMKISVSKKMKISVSKKMKTFWRPFYGRHLLQVAHSSPRNFSAPDIVNIVVHSIFICSRLFLPAHIYFWQFN